MSEVTKPPPSTIELVIGCLEYHIERAGLRISENTWEKTQLERKLKGATKEPVGFWQFRKKKRLSRLFQELVELERKIAKDRDICARYPDIIADVRNAEYESAIHELKTFKDSYFTFNELNYHYWAVIQGIVDIWRKKQEEREREKLLASRQRPPSSNAAYPLDSTRLGDLLQRRTTD